MHSATIQGTTSAVGGAGGIDSNGPAGGNGGAATATITVTGSPTKTDGTTGSPDIVGVTASATGGSGGTSLVTGGFGGAATASSNATGTTVASTAVATGGAGPTGAGSALASAAATGQAGTAEAVASTSLPSGARVTSVTGTALTSVAGTVAVTAESVIRAPAPTFITTKQALALVTGAPLMADTTPVITANPTIAGAIGSSPSLLGLGSLGGSYGTGTTGIEKMTSAADFKIALTSSDLSRDLVVGLYSPTTLPGTGVTGVTIDINASGSNIPPIDISQSFTTAAAAANYFNDHAIDLGSLALPNFASGSVNLAITMTETVDAANSGFFGHFIATG
jgi:hypothetical protein